MSTTMTEPRKPAYTIRRNEEGLTAREQEFRDLYNQKLTGVEIAERMGVNKQRVSEIKKKLEAEGKLTPPKPLDLYSKSEWRAVRAALQKFAGDEDNSHTARDAAVRGLEKARQLVPKGVSW